MAEQLGLQGLAIPEEYGGSGFGYVELGRGARGDGPGAAVRAVLLDRGAGRQHAAAVGDDAAKKEYLPGIASGETIATLAFTEPRGKWDEAGITWRRPGQATAGRCNGTKMFVLDGHTADLIIVAARTAEGREPVRRRRRRRGPHPHGAVDDGPDPQAGQARVRRHAGHADRRRGRRAGTCCRPVLDLAAVGLAAEQVGGAQKVLDMSVEYAKVRVQFGRPIGSFQAIKHKCADMLLEVESAKSAAYYAGWCASEMNDELPSVASLAKAYCSEAYFHAAAENIQIHGGIGFTWEHPAHLYFKRAKTSRAAVRRSDLPPRAARPAHRHLIGDASRVWPTSAEAWGTVATLDLVTALAVVMLFSPRPSCSSSLRSSSAVRAIASTRSPPARSMCSRRRSSTWQITFRKPARRVLTRDEVGAPAPMAHDPPPGEGLAAATGGRPPPGHRGTGRDRGRRGRRRPARRADAGGMEVEDVDVVEVVDAHLDYLAEIGAVGPPAQDPDVP